MTYSLYAEHLQGLGRLAGLHLGLLALHLTVGTGN